MPRLHGVDSAFPTERHLALDATLVLLVNVLTLDRADEQSFLRASAKRRRLHEALA
jgi:hypothetical protein